MFKGKFCVKTVIFVAIIVFLFFAGSNVYVHSENHSDNFCEVGNVKNKVDLIWLDGMKKFGSLERVPVAFFHTRHVEILSKFNYNCDVCHVVDGDLFSSKFKILSDKDRDETMDTYHLNCVKCHKDELISCEKGPITCGGCHNINVWEENTVTYRVVDVFDKLLHQKHLKVCDEKCDTCHHQYDDKLKKLVYNKGSEGSCVYCHAKETADGILLHKDASHVFCISCHQQKIKDGKKAGPLNCTGCHDSFERENFDKSEIVPRIKRNQPDLVFVKVKDENSEMENKLRSVLFDHKSHEDFVSSCKVCHHAGLNSCSECHIDSISDVKNTNKSINKTSNIKFARAMHDLESESSCVGCHLMVQNKRSECIGCHYMKNNSGIPNNLSCDVCHLVSSDFENFLFSGVNGVKKIKDEKEHIVDGIFGDYDFETQLYDFDKIPDVITIDKLKNKYTSVSFPHRKIITSLVNGVKDSKLAVRFHNSQKFVCQSCHHKSLVFEKPPACVNCHNEEKFAVDKFPKPELMSAYHLQCMRCHDSMGLEKPFSRDCVSCHKENVKNS